jgi:hypothetical protein
MKTHLTLVLLFWLVWAQAQPLELPSVQQDYLRMNRRGMRTLGIWALGNLASGSGYWLANRPSSRHFWEMNAYWNTVNLGLAGIGLWSLQRQQRQLWDSHKTRQQHRKQAKIFFINGLLDLGYMGAGLALALQNNPRLRGYGYSLMLQGGFLLVFDGVMWGRSRKVGRRID